jgi:hypothetical protein
MSEQKKPWEPISPNEIAIGNLANVRPPTDAEIQRGIDQAMAESWRDHSRNVHDQGSAIRGGYNPKPSYAPQKTNYPPSLSRQRTADELSTINLLDRMVDAQDAKDKRERERER